MIYVVMTLERKPTHGLTDQQRGKAEVIFRCVTIQQTIPHYSDRLVSRETVVPSLIAIVHRFYEVATN